MAKASVFDRMVADYQPPEYVTTAGGSRLDQLLGDLSNRGFDRVDELVDFLMKPATELPHPKALGFLADIADEYGVGMRGLTATNVSQWRNKRRADQ